MNLKNIAFILFISFIAFSCGKSEEEKQAEAALAKKKAMQQAQVDDKLASTAQPSSDVVFIGNIQVDNDNHDAYVDFLKRAGRCERGSEKVKGEGSCKNLARGENSVEFHLDSSLTKVKSFKIKANPAPQKLFAPNWNYNFHGVTVEPPPADFIFKTGQVLRINQDKGYQITLRYKEEARASYGKINYNSNLIFHCPRCKFEKATMEDYFTVYHKSVADGNVIGTLQFEYVDPASGT